MTYTPVVKQDRNGVKVRVRRNEGGSTVVADCSCFGHPFRVHSNVNCPLLRKRVRDDEA